jgi:hypothetical protein
MILRVGVIAQCAPLSVIEITLGKQLTQLNNPRRGDDQLLLV